MTEFGGAIGVARRSVARGKRAAQRRLRRWFPKLRTWEYVADGWRVRPGEPAPRGWDVDPVIRRYEARLDEFRGLADGTGPLAVPLTPAVEAMPNASDQNTLLVFAYALLRAAWGSERVSVLDWGGGFGYAAFVARAWLPAEVALDYTVVDLPGVRGAAAALVPEVEFLDDASALTRSYDLVVASSSLQYAEDWQAVVERLTGAARRYVLVTDSPFVDGVPSFVVLQRTQEYDIDTEYRGWVFDRLELLAAASAAGLTLEREFVLAFRPDVYGTPARPRYGAFLFGVG